MFGFFKALFFIGIIKKIKSRIFIIVLSLAFIAVFSFFIDDILNIPNVNLYFILSVKWSVISALIIIILFQIKIIFSTNYLSKDDILDDEKKEDENTKHKHKILKKEKLISRSEVILKKYKK